MSMYLLCKVDYDLSGNCSVIIDSVTSFHRLCGGRYKQNKFSVLCSYVIDSFTTSNDV